MRFWNNDKELFELINKELFTCVIGDVMDKIDLKNQFLPPNIKALRQDMKLVGRAKTVLEADCSSTYDHVKNRENAFGVMFEALDSLKEDEIYICTGSSPTYACWGELMSVRALHLKGAGAVLEGYSRDTKGILNLNFPTFSLGAYGQDQGVRGRVIDFDCPIRFSNQVLVNAGDIVVGDIDGVVIIPRDREVEVIKAALAKVRDENMVEIKIREGMPTREVWDKYGVM